jgi:hypothetical protein
MLAGAAARGGTYTQNFVDQDSSTYIYSGRGTLTGGATWSPIIATNRLILTLNQGTLDGSFSPYNLDSGIPIDSFVAKFKLQFGPGSNPPADGAAYSFGPEVDQNSVTYGEVGAGGSAFSVSFHTYTSFDGPAVDAYLFGKQIGHVKMPVGSMVNSQLQDVIIQLKANSTIDVTYAGQVIFTNLYLEGWGPTNGYHIISARTGGSSEETHIASVNIVTTPFTTTVAPTITSVPQPATVNEGASTNFMVGFDGTGPFTIQWLKNGNPIPNATNQTLTLTAVPYADNNAQISAKVTNLANSATSASATLTVIRDQGLPTVAKASADTLLTGFLITYSKPVSDTALTASHYTVDHNVTISSVARLSPTVVKLNTAAPLPEGTLFTLTINGVQDTATIPNTIAANTKVQVSSFVFLAKTVLHKKYNNIADGTGWPISNLFQDSRYPNLPDRQDIETGMEYPPGGAARIPADDDPAAPGTHLHNYFDSVEGYFIPPATTNYVFYVAGADRINLYLSTDSDPANQVEIAELNGWTNPRRWTEGQPVVTNVPVPIPSAQSDQFANTAWPYGNIISLTAGERYYMLLVHHDPSWSGGDEFAVTYKYEGEPDPTPGDAPKLTGSVMGYFFDPTGASINFVQQPTSQAAVQGGTATFTASATGSSVYGTTLLYQWQSAPKGSSTWTDIAGATSASYTTALLGLGDDGTQYRVVATVAPITQTSVVVSVSVTTDKTPPLAHAGAMPDSVAGTVDIGIGFNKSIDPTTVGVPANYSVSAGTITSLTVYTNRFTADSQNPLVKLVKQSVVLTVTGLSGSGTVTVQNVKDTFGNVIVTTNIPFTVSTMKWGVVGANELGFNNAAVQVAANGFDVYSDGIGEWANYDEATFAYEQVTGDFDKKVRVEYQDGSSQWARAGLIVREATGFGVNRATQATQAGRYQKCFVAPVGPTLTGPGSLGASDWELNRRLDVGGQTDGAPFTGTGSAPQYPNAWCRIQRVGQTFNLFRSDDGVTWVKLGATTWGQDDVAKNPMPTTLYVGPEFSPENGNLPTVPDRGTFLAQFRDYGNYVVATNPTLTIAPATGGKVTITWSAGTLISSPTIGGTYAPVNGAVSPFTVTPGAATTTFYRVKQ